MQQIKNIFLLLASITWFLPVCSAQNLVEAQLVGSSTIFEMNIYASIAGTTIRAKNPVDLVRVLYTTPGVQGATDTASGLLVLPRVDNDEPRPVVLYQHGTTAGRDDVPSNATGLPDLLATFEIFIASQGYIVSSPDYLGLGTSRGFHPYVHAGTEAQAGIDLFIAAQDYLSQEGIEISDKLFVTGYSQGGHAAMALHRVLQENWSTTYPVTAAAPMSGPYSISTFTTRRILGDDPYDYPGYLAYTLEGYQYVYGDLYQQHEEIYKEPFASIIRSTFASPDYNVFSLHNVLQDSLTAQYGASVVRNMFQDSILMGIATNPDHRILRRTRENDTYDWRPDAPVRLYYCDADDQVPFTNSILADSVMQENGAADVAAISVNPLLTHGACAIPAVEKMLDFFDTFLETSPVQVVPDATEIAVFPNPASTDLHIRLNNAAHAQSTFGLYDAHGCRVRSGTSNTEAFSIDLGGLPAGMYVLRIVRNQTTTAHQVIIQKAF